MSAAEKDLTGYDYSRQWFDFCFANPELVKPSHTALYFFTIEQKNRLGWKEKFGLPSGMSMEAIGIKSYNTYINTLNDLVEWGFIKMIERSKNQYSSNIVALLKFNKANDKALDKALIKHSTKHTLKQSESTVQSTSESIDSIDKQINNRTINKETINNTPDATAPVENKSLFNSSKNLFLVFYKNTLKTEYFFEAKDGAKLKGLLKKIEFQVKAKCSEKKEIFDPDTLPMAFEYFITQAYKKSDTWVQQHFTLSTLDSKFNDIFTLIQNGKSANNNQRQSNASPAERAAALYSSGY